jgi:ABC-2 type transport system ATP-binding protein
MRIRTLSLLAAAGALVAGAFAAVPAAQANTTTNGCIQSVPDPGTTAPVSICYSLFQPAGASAANPVPVIFHSHGWGGSRTTTASSFTKYLDAGFSVLSFDQRGFGQSGGKAHVENPDVEGYDVEKLVDLVADLDWVEKDAPGDPVLGAIGGSYGGGYQMVGAFGELYHHGSTRFDALAPEITWHDLQDSLAPSKVVRTTWVSALYAAGARAHTDTVHQGFAEGVATGDWPTAMDAFFAKNGPKWHADNGRLLDIPVLFGQGVNDNLFNLNQGLHNFDKVLTPAARAQSIFVGYNGGHVLPNALPLATAGSGDPCTKKLGSNSFGDLALRFFQEKLLGQDKGLTGFGQYHITTLGSTCRTTSSIANNTDVALGTIATTVGAGAPTHIKVADGPISTSGIARLTAEATGTSIDNRAFFALSVGTSPANATVIQNNMMPLRFAGPTVTPVTVDVELPGVAVDVPAGQSLFLTVSPLSDMSIGHGSRAPGALVLSGSVLHLPVV